MKNPHQSPNLSNGLGLLDLLVIIAIVCAMIAIGIFCHSFFGCSPLVSTIIGIAVPLFILGKS